MTDLILNVRMFIFYFLEETTKKVPTKMPVPAATTEPGNYNSSHGKFHII